MAGPEPDAQRAAGEDEPVGRADSAGATHDRVAAYLRDPKNTQLQNSLKRVNSTAKAAKSFKGAEFEVEIFALTMVPSGSWKLTLMVPPDSADEVLKLKTTSGLLLKASVSTLEGPEAS